MGRSLVPKSISETTVPNDRTIFMINYFTMLALACSIFPGWADFFTTFIENAHEDPARNVALIAIGYATLAGGWFIFREAIVAFANAVIEIRDWVRSLRS